MEEQLVRCEGPPWRPAWPELGEKWGWGGCGLRWGDTQFCEGLQSRARSQGIILGVRDGSVR